MADPPDPPGRGPLRMPAEWAPHEATWLAWPHDPRTWIAGLEPVEDAFETMIAALAPHERVELMVTDATMADRIGARLREAGLDVIDPVYEAGPKGEARPLVEGAKTPPSKGVVRLHLADHVDSWVRDYGPTFTHDEDGTRVAVDWPFDAWGGKYEALERDDRLGRFIAEVHGAPRRRPDLVTEGGALEVDGDGTLATTEPCLLDPARNKDPDRAEIEATLAELLGAKTVLWLPEGLVGDDTDGHVDTLARFTAPGRIALPIEEDPQDPNHAVLAANRDRLEAYRERGDVDVEIVELPMPGPVLHQGQRYPASYANFYIGNGTVVVPVFDDPADEAALAVLEDAFPRRRVVPVAARALVVGFGACHCLTQQVPTP